MSIFSRPYLALVALIGIIVPRRLRPDWRKEWEAELQHRERLLSEWHRLDRAARWHLLRRSVGAFRDALWLQRQRWEDDAVQDVRLAVRMLTKSPAFTLAVLLTLGLGIGANAAIYTAVNALLFRPIDGVPDPGRLVQIYRQYPTVQRQATRRIPTTSTIGIRTRRCPVWPCLRPPPFMSAPTVTLRALRASWSLAITSTSYA